MAYSGSRDLLQFGETSASISETVQDRDVVDVVVVVGLGRRHARRIPDRSQC